MEKRSFLEIITFCLCANLLAPSAFVFAEPLNLTVPKIEPETELRIFSVNFNTLTPATSFVMEQVVKKVVKRIENTFSFVTWPQFDSGERIYGAVKATITIHKDGTIMNIETGSRGIVTKADQLLAEAAIKIIESAAPFAPIPNEYFPGFDAIRLTRSFVFSHRARPAVN